MLPSRLRVEPEDSQFLHRRAGKRDQVLGHGVPLAKLDSDPSSSPIPQFLALVGESIYDGSGRTWNRYWLAFALKLEGKAS